MFERFNELARQVLIHAQDEARALGDNYVGSEHLLLGLLRGERGIASSVLAELGITLEAVREQVARIIGQGDELVSSQIPFTPRAKKVLELARREALSLGQNYIGTEHVLLGIVREDQSVAARILLELDASPEEVRNEIIRQLSGAGPRPPRRPLRPKVTIPRELARSFVEFREGAIFPDDHPVSRLAAAYKQLLD